ncbi:MAG TPA: hypothetical protein VGO06_28460 [Bosea sp. (in: a-proteobacteria)]|jgi:hypothetical protein|uniref:hypothetical protein n=1 Tax=Bosea sp. (in: a-proteobacteria) TaxID=1871050 RepID=UPI002E106952|nr:hypothetical protein [Bosea sp. (in: a-proteobacteria)]
MKGNVASRIVRLEQLRKPNASNFILWSASDDPAAVPEKIEFCGLSHEECLDILDAEENLQ